MIYNLFYCGSCNTIIVVSSQTETCPLCNDYNYSAFQAKLISDNKDLNGLDLSTINQNLYTIDERIKE